ncbi:MAG: hypothetical protein ACFCVB_12815 [Nodosilinea sp.]
MPTSAEYAPAPEALPSEGLNALYCGGDPVTSIRARCRRSLALGAR